MYNLHNLSKLYNEMINIQMTGGYKKKYSSYEQCKDDIVGTIMKEYKKNKLETRYGYPVTEKSQAIAIALNQTHSNCKYNKEERKHLIDKVNKDFNDKNKEIILSNLIEMHDVLHLMVKERKHKEVDELKTLLWNKIIETYRDGKTLDNNMLDEIKKINDL